MKRKEIAIAMSKQELMSKVDALQADVDILEKKHEFLMEILTEKQLQEYEDFCEEHGF